MVPVMIPEKDLLDPESMPTFDDDDNADAHGESRNANGDGTSRAKKDASRTRLCPQKTGSMSSEKRR